MKPSKNADFAGTRLIIRSHLKNRILVPDSVYATRKAWLRRDTRGGAEFQTAGNLLVVEDLKRGTHPAKKAGGPKDIFEIASRNIIGIFPYLAVMGMIWGYLANASSGAVAGLLIAAAASVLIGTAPHIFSERLNESGAETHRNPDTKNAGVRKHSAEDLNVVRYHRLCHQFDDALFHIEAVLANDPAFVEALFLKAQILWEGFGDANKARECLLKILRVEPDKNAVFHRWALNFREKLASSEK